MGRMYKCQDVQVPWWTVNLYGFRYSQCNDDHCKHDNFGWRYKDQHHKPASESKRQFSLPSGSRGTQWKDMCLERAVSTECIQKTTFYEGNMASVSAIFQ